jgi:diadenosine tetraphosphate (Ap4A) HIT family hydrolase
MASENATMLKFGYPDTLIAEYPAWVILLRPQQVTAGALVLAHRGGETAFASLPAAAFSGLQQAVGDIERNLKTLVQYERINYLMLMMVDPHVHFHVLPRYSGSRSLGGLEIPDHGWPRTPDLAKFVAPAAADLARTAQALRAAWKRA